MFDYYSADEGRIRRAKSKAMTPASVDKDAQTAEFLGSTGTYYHTTMTECDCTDFKRNLKGEAPCKHILRLGMELGIYPALNMQSDKKGIENQYRKTKTEDYVRYAPISYAMNFVLLLQIISDKEYKNLPDKHNFYPEVLALLAFCPDVKQRSNGKNYISNDDLEKYERLLSNRIGKLSLELLHYKPLCDILETIDISTAAFSVGDIPYETE